MDICFVIFFEDSYFYLKYINCSLVIIILNLIYLLKYKWTRNKKVSDKLRRIPLLSTMNRISRTIRPRKRKEISWLWNKKKYHFYKNIFLSNNIYKVLKQAFDLFDTDGSGNIDEKELRDAMKVTLFLS
jgi:hypothetical protein